MSRSGGRTVFLCAIAGLVAAALLAAPCGLPAQAPAPEDAPFRAWALGATSWKWTEVAGRESSLFGGRLAIGLTPTTLLGGAGFRLHGSASPDSDGRRTGRRLDFGYGGVVVEHLRPFAEGWALSGSALAGAGHATVRASGGALQLGADNFGVVELEAGPVWSGGSRLQLSMTAGYRFAFGVQDLPGVTSSDLRGPALTVGLGLAFR